MRDIIISIRNDFVAEAIIHSLKKAGDFQPYKLLFSRDDEVIRECEAVQPEILLSEVAFGKATDLKTRLAEAKAVRANTPMSIANTRIKLNIKPFVLVFIVFSPF